MKKYIILIYLLISIIIYSRQRTFLVPHSHLNNDRILNVPPIKIEGFILGMKKNTFLKFINKRHRNISLEKRKVRAKNPKIDLYILQLLNEEKMVFYTYNDILTKIYIVYIRPFDSMERIKRLYVFRYGTPKVIFGKPTRINNPDNYNYKLYIWKKYYRFTPEFLREKLDVRIMVTLDFSLRGRHLRKIVYGYCLDENFIKLFILNN